VAITRTSWTRGNGPSTKFQPGQSGNPNGRSKATLDIIEAARALTPRALAALEKALDDPDRAVQAAQILLDRAWGKPPVAVYARFHPDADADGVVRYEFVWGKAQEDPADAGRFRQTPTIDAGASNGAAEGEAEAEPSPSYCWGDGTPVR
jgi:hypothetical protein